MKATFLLPIPDHRLAQGKLYDLPRLLPFSILAVMSGETSYRWGHQFIRTHRARLNETFGCCWRQTPAHRSIPYALQGLDVNEIAPDFHAHVLPLAEQAAVIALIGPARQSRLLQGPPDRLGGEHLRRRRMDHAGPNPERGCPLGP